MSILSWLPDFVFHIIFLVGVLAIIAGYFLDMIPFISNNAKLIQVLGIVVTVVGVWFEGGISRDHYYQEKILELKQKIAEAEVRAEQLNAKLTEILLKNQQLTHDVADANRKRLAAESAQLNQQCTINQNIVDIINDAAKNRRGVAK